MAIASPAMIFGALAYRSAKKRMLGQVAATTRRRIAEGIALTLIVMTLWFQRSAILYATDNAPYLVIPVWSILAYAFVGFRAPQVPDTPNS